MPGTSRIAVPMNPHEAEGEVGGGYVLDDKGLAGHYEVPLAPHGIHSRGDGLTGGHTQLGQYATKATIIVPTDCSRSLPQVPCITGLTLGHNAHGPRMIAAFFLKVEVGDGALQARPNERVGEQVVGPVGERDMRVRLAEYKSTGWRLDGQRLLDVGGAGEGRGLHSRRGGGGGGVSCRERRAARLQVPGLWGPGYGVEVKGLRV